MMQYITEKKHVCNSCKLITLNKNTTLNVTRVFCTSRKISNCIIFNYLSTVSQIFIIGYNDSGHAFWKTSKIDFVNKLVND